MPGTISFLKQSFPGSPEFSEDQLGDLHGKVIIVTGSNTGMGKELARILYAKHATVYMMARSEDKTNAAIDNIRTAVPKSAGKMIYLPLDLSDLNQVASAARAFLTRESRLDILFNNAGVGYPGKGAVSKQGYELQLGVNCLGTFALTRALTPALTAGARASPRNSVRVVWVASSAAEGVHPKHFLDQVARTQDKNAFEQYCISKLGAYLLAAEYARRHRPDGVVSVALNPGNLDSDFWRTQGALTACLLRKTLLHPPVYGAYTALFAGLSPDVTLEKSGSFVAPWGKFWALPKEFTVATTAKAQGGDGTAQEFWEWAAAQIKPYA